MSGFGRQPWIRAGLVLAVLVAVVGCSGSGTNPTGSANTVLVGKAIFPPQAGGGAVKNAPFIVLNLDNSQTEFSGSTDNGGTYSAAVAVQNAVAVIVNGTTATGQSVRVSGLLNPSQQGRQKDFNGTTDIACQAGVTAVGQGAIRGSDLGATRIQNLEAAAALVVGQVNFFDKASIAAAANQVRTLTGDGAHPPA